MHVTKPPDGLIVIRLAIGDKPQEVWEFYNVRKRDVLRAFRIVEEYEAAIRAAWEEIHGK